MKFFKINASILYSVSPKEIGTGMCESLSSYIIRLSTEHNIITGALINKIMAPILDSRYILNSSSNGGNRFYDGAKSLNSFDKSASEFTRILGLLTGRNDIKETTLIEIKDLIASRDLLKNNLAWCPMCLNQWKEDAYYPLIWFFKDVKVCVQHNCGLKDICPSCDKHLPILHRKMLIGYCPYCSNWLGTNEIKRIENNKELFKAKEISNLVANRSFLARGSDKETISNALLQLINCYTNGNLAEFARLINIPKVTLWDWVYGGRLPSLGKILDVCFNSNVSLTQLLNGDFKINLKFNEKIEPKREKNLIRRKINQEKLQRKLEVFLSQNPSISLSKVSKILGYDRKVLMSKFPEICHVIVNQHKEYCIQQKYYRSIELMRGVDKAITYLQENEVYPSRRKVEKFLDKPGLLHERRIREEWLKKILE
ncbi:TniQ family protein [Bacillus cereus]|uniref:TniQ family protein n=1 Tax=Bacillus cereus TaxID=1396 RepID=UPI0018F4EA5C|nr:TniQ family protein [Bacillus cereus]MBJ8024936.1 TniQ family protein [Bacillus cereus]MBJ8037447.1 TniQ family protein [Bacillus cereus]